MLLKGRPIVPGEARGLALVSSKPLSFLGGVDAKTGVIIERGHDLYGVGVKDKILCFPHGRGSTVGSYVLYALAKNGVAPRAIVNSLADPVVVVGAVIANIPMVDYIDISMIKTGDLIEVDGGKGLVRICRK
ncbi:DUF126 domain-containing protein [Candidatus Bathyarchaeota archaeon]|nr:DUF126 domain-containing protein [Candidatus Bathyarchaeota archaeon]